MKGKTVLVTGATGFVGGALTRRLAADGANVRAFVRSPYKARSLQSLPNVEVVMGDVTDPGSLRPAADGCACVFHTAVDYGDLETQRSVNVEGTRNAARAAAEAGVERFVHVSSIAVYGYGRVDDVDEDIPLTITQRDPYHITKVEAELVVRAIAEADNLAYSIIRPGMIYGAGSGMWTERLFRLATLRPMPFVGYGDGTAHPIYVDDVTDMMVTLATHPAARSQTFNCTPDPAPTWRQWLGGYMRLAGNRWWLAVPPGAVMLLAQLVALAMPPGHPLKDVPALLGMTQKCYRYRMAKARTLLGWQPQVDLQTGIQRCAPWLREIGLLR